MAEANEVTPKPPAVATVTLCDGSIVAVEKWAPTSKMAAMIQFIGDLDHLRDLVRGSLSEADRPKADTMLDEDCFEVASAAIALNVTPRLAENIRRYGAQVLRITSALKG